MANTCPRTPRARGRGTPAADRNSGTTLSSGVQLVKSSTREVDETAEERGIGYTCGQPRSVFVRGPEQGAERSATSCSTANGGQPARSFTTQNTAPHSTTGVPRQSSMRAHLAKHGAQAVDGLGLRQRHLLLEHCEGQAKESASCRKRLVAFLGKVGGPLLLVHCGGRGMRGTQLRRESGVNVDRGQPSGNKEAAPAHPHSMAQQSLPSTAVQAAAPRCQQCRESHPAAAAPQTAGRWRPPPPAWRCQQCLQGQYARMVSFADHLCVNREIVTRLLAIRAAS